MSIAIDICNCKTETCTCSCLCKSYDCFLKRYRTFKNFPTSSFMNTFDLAQAGFQYRQISDVCYCHVCKLQIFKWINTDCAFTEHVRLSPNCPLIRKLFNKMDYVDTKPNLISFDTVDNKDNFK